MRPMFSTRNDAVQITHHLAAVTNPEREGIAAFKETGKFIARPRIEQDGLGPAFAGAQYVAIGKTTTGGKSCEIFQADAAADDIAHMHVVGFEAGTIESCRHLQLA